MDIEAEREKIARLIVDDVNHYPDLEALLNDGKITVRSGWYKPMDKATFDLLMPYAKAVRVLKDGSGELKLRKLTKASEKMAAKAAQYLETKT